MPHPTQKGIQFSLSSFDPAIKAHADALAQGRGVSLRQLTESLIEEAYREEIEMFKFNAHTSLTSIRQRIYDDFGIKIDDAFAKSLRENKAHGCVVWTPAHLIDVKDNVTIEPGHIKVNGAAYTAQEWNS